jgi:hypothetical protein
MKRATCLASLLLLAGCGGSQHAAIPSRHRTVQATRTYTDPVYHFSFKYPSSWSAPGRGSRRIVDRTKAYVVRLRPPGNRAEVFVAEMPRAASPLPRGPKPIVHRVSVTAGGRKAAQVQQVVAGFLSQEDTLVHAGAHYYDLRVGAASPPFQTQVLAGYNGLVASFQAR